MLLTVAIDDLKVGMFVHLELGWWAHPFALSNFAISSPDQIQTLRGLGLRQVRWSPEKSQLDVPPEVADESVTGAANQPATPGTAAAAAAVEPPPAEPTAAAPAPAPATPAQPLRMAIQPPRLASPATRVLEAQRSAQRLCEQQYHEAGAAWLEAQRQLPSAPEQARVISEGLTRALLDKLMVDQEMCVRVLSGVAGEPNAAHAMNVTVISLLMARVFGFGPDDMLDLGLGALLHDVGKHGLPERARHADPRALPAELQRYRSHVALGLVQGQRMGLRPGALSVLAQHHELADGSGFPNGLVQDNIALAGRIVALINRYDNLCNPPQAANGLTPHEALSLIFAQSRGQFDATMLNAFIRMMGVYPPGSVVQLTDDRYASVVSVNSSRPLKPRVLVCDPHLPPEEALLLNLDGQADLGIRRSLKPGQLPAAARDYLSPSARTVYFFEPVAAFPAAGAAQQALAA